MKYYTGLLNNELYNNLSGIKSSIRLYFHNELIVTVTPKDHLMLNLYYDT